MGITTGDDSANNESAVKKVDVPKEVNPINKEIPLSPEVREHTVLSKEMVQNKTPWFENTSIDMYKSAISEMTGSRQHVEYFNMITNKDSISSGDSSLISSVHREYLRILNYPIFLEGGLDTSTDSKEQKTDTKASANICGVLPPQTGDYFVMSTESIRTSLFKIAEVTPLSIYTDRAYSVEFAMEEVDLGPIYANLISKTTRRLNYSRENHSLGIKYLLTDGEVADSVADRLANDSLFRDYVSEYYSADLKVFGFKTSNGFHTDMFIQDFLRHIEICPSDMFTYSEYEETKELDTIFDIIVSGNTQRFSSIMTKVYYYNLTSMTELPSIHPVLLSPITSMPFQKSSRTITVREPLVARSDVYNCGTSVLKEIKISDLVDRSSVSNDPMFPNVIDNDTYILSERFYSGDGGNELERQLLNPIQGRTIDRTKVMELVDGLSRLSHEERFFLTPFVIILIKILRG